MRKIINKSPSSDSMAFVTRINWFHKEETIHWWMQLREWFWTWPFCETHAHNGDHTFPPIFWMLFPQVKFPSRKVNFLPFRKFDASTFKEYFCSNKTYCCSLIFESVQNLLKMRIDDFGVNADGWEWPFRTGNLTLGKSELKMRENGWSP